MSQQRRGEEGGRTADPRDSASMSTERASPDATTDAATSDAAAADSPPISVYQARDSHLMRLKMDEFSNKTGGLVCKA